METKYIVFYHNDRGPDDYDFLTKEQLKNINNFAEYVNIYKLSSPELTLKQKQKLGLTSIEDRTD